MRAAESTQARKSGFHMGRKTDPTSASASTTAVTKEPPKTDRRGRVVTSPR